MTVSERQGACAECGRAFVRKGGGRGRPARYCGQVCRRAAEYELGRTQGLLRRSQQRHQDACLEVATASHYSKIDAEKTRDFWAAEVERLRLELRRLLASDIDSPGSSPTYPNTA